MIVRETETSLLLISQPDHARLAQRIMQPGVALARAEHRESILRALAEHDNGWREVDASPLVDMETGRILDFVSAPASVRQGVWPRAVTRLSHDPWAAALVAQHALTVYDRLRADAAWAGFFDDMAIARERYLEQTRRSLDELRTDYVFVRLGDLASLAFCTVLSGEVAFGGYAVRLVGSRVVIAPDPYAGRVVSFEIAARELPRRPFHSDADAQSAFIAARTVTLTGEASGPAQDPP